MKYILVFDSTHVTMKVETFLKRDQIPFKLRMKPRGISAECGLALEVDRERLKAVAESLQRRGVRQFKVFGSTPAAGDYLEVPWERIIDSDAGKER